MRVLIYDEKQHDPWLDNESRKRNRAVNRVCRSGFKINTPRGRRRKKEILAAEFPRYVQIVAMVADERQR